MDEGVEVEVTQTPEEELASRVATYGVFAGASMDVDHVAETVTVTLKDTLKGKDKITVTTDIANAAAWIFNDVFDPVVSAANKVKSFKGK